MVCTVAFPSCQTLYSHDCWRISGLMELLSVMKSVLCFKNSGVIFFLCSVVTCPLLVIVSHWNLPVLSKINSQRGRKKKKNFCHYNWGVCVCLCVWEGWGKVGWGTKLGKGVGKMAVWKGEYQDAGKEGGKTKTCLVQCLRVFHHAQA